MKYIDNVIDFEQFGGAYTTIPFIEKAAVIEGGWITTAQFLDGIALSNIVPAPTVIFTTFIGYVGGGFSGAFLMTIGMVNFAFSHQSIFLFHKRNKNNNSFCLLFRSQSLDTVILRRSLPLRN